MKSSELAKPTRTDILQAAKADLWRMGDLTYLFHAEQLKVWREIEARPDVSQWALEIARKWGKTFFLVAMCAMFCRRYPKVRIPYGAPTLKHLEEFVLPVLDEVAADAPEDIRPIYKPADGHWFFPGTESWVHLFGADDKSKANRGRGPKALIAVFDECGFTPVLNVVLKDVFRPSMLYKRIPGRPRFTILGSTPSDEAGHEYTRICEIAEANGHHFRQTTYQNPMLSASDVEEFIAENARDNGMTVEEYKKSDEFRREYLAERINDRRLTAVPAWAESGGRFLAEVPRPIFFDAYTGFDPGGVDPHAGLLGFLDYKNNRLVIEDEVFLREGQDTGQIADELKVKEKALWGGANHTGTLRGLREAGELPDWLHIKTAQDERSQPFLRVSDTDTQFILDMLRLHGVAFVPAVKTDKALHINELNVLIRQGRLWIHPRCRNLDRQLKTTVWKNHKRTEFQRKNGEHGDLVDALSYMARRVAWHVNPFPPNWDKDPRKVFIPPSEDLDGDEAGLREAFKGFDA